MEVKIRKEASGWVVHVSRSVTGGALDYDTYGPYRTKAEAEKVAARYR